MKRFAAIAGLLMALLFTPLAFAGSLPDTARLMAAELDAQLVERLGLPFGPAKGTSLVLTPPVELSNLERATPLSLAMAEELATWFVKAGYRVQEIRKSQDILFEPGNGELLLTRRSDLLAQKNVPTELVLTGTYSLTMESVRFNIRLIQAGSNEVVAMSSRTLPVVPEVYDLLPRQAAASLSMVAPSVGVSLGRTMPLN